MTTISTQVINWNLMAGSVDMEENRLLFAKIRKDVFIAIPESKEARCWAPMLILNPKSPIVRGGLAKKYTADILGIAREHVQGEILRQLIRATADEKRNGPMDRLSVVEAMLPFEARLEYTAGDTPDILRQFLVPAWTIELLDYQRLRIGWVDVKDVLHCVMPKSLRILPDKPYDEESWRLLTAHNVPDQLVELLEHNGIAIRQKRPRKRNKRSR